MAGRKRRDYKTEEAQRMGLAGDMNRGIHGASRNPATGLLFKLPGHETVNLAVREDQSKGYRTRVSGQGLSSYQSTDPRSQAGSVAAPRDRDISGAIFESETVEAIKAGRAPRTAERRRKRGKYQGATLY